MEYTMMNRVPENVLAVASRLPFKMFLMVLGDKDAGYESLQSFKKLLSHIDPQLPDESQQILSAALENYPVHYREFVAGSLIDDPSAMKGALDSLQAELPEDRFRLLRGEIMKFASRLIANLNSDKSDALIERLDGIFQGTVSEGFRRRIGALPKYTPAPEEVALNGTVAPPKPLQANYVPAPDRIVWWEKGPVEATCVRVIDETHDVKTFCFRVHPDLWFSYNPGQFITLELVIDGKKVKRSYSLGSSPSRPHTLEITVKRAEAPSKDIPPGLVSNWLHDNMKVGDRITFKGPNGRFSCAGETNKKLLMISAGSGIVPVMGMARFLCDTHADCDIIFYHSARTMDDFIFRRELERMASYYHNFRLVLTVTRPRSLDPYFGFTGRISLEQLRLGFPDFMDRAIYLCGPNVFMENVKAILEEAGFPMKQFNWESFGGAATPKPTKATKEAITHHAEEEHHKKEHQAAKVDASSPSAGEVTVVFQKSGKEVLCTSEDYILDIAENNGIEIAFCCRSGSCGECKIRKSEGDVEMEAEDGLLDEDRDQGYILSCVGKAKGRIVLDI